MFNPANWGSRKWLCTNEIPAGSIFYLQKLFIQIFHKFHIHFFQKLIQECTFSTERWDVTTTPKKIHVHETTHRKNTLLHAIRWMTWLKTPMKGVTSYIMLRVVASILWTGDSRMWLHNKSERIGNAGNWNILVPVGKEINWDAVSKSDWKQYKANWIRWWKPVEMWFCGLPFVCRLLRRSDLERSTVEGDSPVSRRKHGLVSSWVSFTGYWTRMENQLRTLNTHQVR